MDNVYVSKPFFVEDGEDVSINPIEMSNKNIKANSVTRGVLYKDNTPAQNYIIKIYRVSKAGKMTFIGFTFTDSFGQFMIPFSAKSTQYVIKVFSLKEETENLEMFINK